MAVKKTEEQSAEVSLTSEFTVNQLCNFFAGLLSDPENIMKVKPMIWGAPGVGKSSMVHKLGETLKQQLKKKVVVRDIRLLLFNPVDLRGIPVADAQREFAIWLKPKIFDFDPSDKVVNILFFDELPNAPQSVQNAALQIVQDRQIGEHRIPDNTLIIGAGNRVTDRAGANRLTTSMANRFQHFTAVPSIQDWKQWAIPAKIDHRIIGFLNFRENLLFKFDASQDEYAFPTPRSWEMASNFLSIAKQNLGISQDIMSLVAPCVGRGVAAEFNGYLRVYENLPSIDDIVAGKAVETPNKPDVLYALCSSLVARIAEIKDVKQKENVIKFITQIPVDFGVKTFHDMLSLPNCEDMLRQSKSFLNWAGKHGQVFA